MSIVEICIKNLYHNSMFDEYSTARLDSPALSSQSIKMLNKIGARAIDSRIDLIDDCRVVLSKMPKGKRGVCVGSGDNTSIWRERGWDTLDIEGSHAPTYIADANTMVRHIGSDKYDYVYIEDITMSNSGTDGAERTRLIKQANAILKKGGKLIIRTADFGIAEKRHTSLPIAEYFIPFLIKNGFRPILEVTDRKTFLDPVRKKDEGVGVFYYAEKISDGFDKQRYPHATPFNIDHLK